MAMHNQPHLKPFIQEVYLKPNEISCREPAFKLGVAASTINRVLNEIIGVSPKVGLRFSKALGRSPESWLTMQDNYDLWQARQTVDLKKVRKIEFRYAQPYAQAELRKSGQSIIFTLCGKLASHVNFHNESQRTYRFAQG